MAKTRKATAKDARSENKKAFHVRMTKKDYDTLLRVLDDLKGGGTGARGASTKGRASVTDPEVIETLKEVHRSLCMSSPPSGKLVVIDVDGNS